MLAVEFSPRQRVGEDLKGQQAKLLRGGCELGEGSLAEAISAAHAGQAQEGVEEDLTLVVPEIDRAPLLVDLQAEPQAESEQAKNVQGLRAEQPGQGRDACPP